MLKYVAWTQVTAIGIYQALENGAFLSGKGIVGWSAETQAKAWKWSSRAWMLYVGLELSRLGYEFRQRSDMERKSKALDEVAEKIESSGVLVPEGGLKTELEKRDGRGEVEEREEKREREAWWARWRKDAGVNLAYAPMTVHYSVEEGFLGEGALGVLGVVVAWWKIGGAWRMTT